MGNKTEVTIDVIIHATEDITKFQETFHDVFSISPEEFSIQDVSGHYDNPITIMNAKIVKEEAMDFVNTITSMLSEEQMDEIISNLDTMIDNSTLYLRISKQDFVEKRITLQENNAIKIKIYTPIYSKKNTLKAFTDLLKKST